MKKFLFISVFIFTLLFGGTVGFFVKAVTVNIGILNNIKVTTLIITPLTGDYDIVADGKSVYKLSDQGFVHLTLRDNHIYIITSGRVLGSFTKLSFIASGKDCSFQIKEVIPPQKPGIYDDNLDVSLCNEALQLVNTVDIEKYVAGVVESEVGKKRTVEFYKVQSIICRTYAMSHLRRHENEEFHLCDKVHCQVYRGKCSGSDSYNILNGVLSTNGMVIIDSNKELITATYHSNCGGQTINSEDLWMLPKPYLKSVKDPFCVNQQHAQWEMQIPTEKWIQYLSDKYDYPVEEGKSYSYAVNYAPQKREAYFTHYPDIPLKTLRSDWRFKSTYFSISSRSEDDSGEKNGSGVLTFKGRGNGHGVGLCQEGAINMAQMGYSYREILHFYYTGVNLLNISELEALLR